MLKRHNPSKLDSCHKGVEILRGLIKVIESHYIYGVKSFSTNCNAFDDLLKEFSSENSPQLSVGRGNSRGLYTGITTEVHTPERIHYKLNYVEFNH